MSADETWPSIEFTERQSLPVKGSRAEVFDNPERLAEHKAALPGKLKKSRAALEAAIARCNTLDLLWHINWLEICRVQQMTNIETSNVAGYLRFLRTILVMRPMVSNCAPTTTGQLSELVSMLDDIWDMSFEVYMLESDAPPGASKRDKRKDMAAFMAVLQASETEVAHTDHVWMRLSKIMAPFNQTVIEPALGGSADDVHRAFVAIGKALGDKIDAARRLIRLDRTTGLPRPTPSQVFDPAVNQGAVFCFRREELQAAINPLPVDQFLEYFCLQFPESPSEMPTPTDDTVVRRRPFAWVSNEVVVLLEPIYGIMAPKYVLPSLFNTHDALKRLHRRRDVVLEEEVADILTRIVKPERSFRNYYVLDSNGELCENDILMLRDNIAFIAECKAKPFRSFVRTGGNARKAMDDFGKNIQAGYDQASRVDRLLRAGSMPIRDRHGNVLDSVPPVSQTFMIVGLDTSAKVLGTELEPWLEKEPEAAYPWIVDTDTLRAIELRLNNFKSFCRFLAWRIRLHGRVMNADEACFAGFFLCHGARQFPAEACSIAIDPSYSDLFDEEYFLRKGHKPPRVRFDIDPAFSTMARDTTSFDIGIGRMRSGRQRSS